MVTLPPTVTPHTAYYLVHGNLTIHLAAIKIGCRGSKPFFFFIMDNKRIV
jgi:hypothetical protein